MEAPITIIPRRSTRSRGLSGRRLLPISTCPVRGSIAPGLLLVLALLLAGCASTADPRVASQGTSTILNFPGARSSMLDGEAGTVAPTMITAPVEQVWSALLEALPEVGVPLETVHQASWTAGTESMNVRRRFADRPISTYLTCGGTAGVAEVADAHAVTMGILATLQPVTNGTQLSMQVVGSAKDPFTSVPARHCVSRGRLEAAVDSTLRVILQSP